MGWVSKLLDLCKRYGKPAKFAATSILGAVLPGSPAVVALVEQAFDTAVEKAKDQWEIAIDRRLEASAGDLERLGDMLDLLQGDLQHVTAQVARLEHLPGVAHQVIETALVSDPRAQDAARRLEGMAARFERLEQQQQQLLAGQEEMLPLLRRAVGVCDYIDELRASGFSVDVFAELLRGFQSALRLLGQGKTAEAELALEAVSAARPMSVAATVALAAAQSVSHNFMLAEQTLGRASRLKPGDLELTELHSRATSLSRRGETPPVADAPGSPGKHQPREGDVLDGWTLETLLGHGGWGLVFKANREGRVRALKIMHAELSAAPLFVERFKREIITLAKLGKHPHLVEIDSFGYATGHGCWYFLMEWLDGITLEQHLARHGALAWPVARELFLLLSDGLAEAHQRGIVHRDIKPANIMLRPDGRPALVDFGLALEADTSMTRTGRSAGYTALFAAPEQIRKNQADARSDVYSLAASLYYALTYSDPTRREPHCFKPRFVPESARDVLTRALDNDPAERPANAAVFREILQGMARPLIAEDFAALASAVREAPAGSQVIVRPGVYRGSLVLERSIEIIGEGPASEIVLESGTGSCLTLRGGEALLRGVTLQGKEAHSPAVQASEGRLTLESCIVSSEASACVSAAGESARLVLKRCTLRDAREQGVLLSGGAGAEMEECEIVRTGGPGVEVQQGCSLMLRQSLIHASKSSGLFVTASAVTVERCTIRGNALANVMVKSGGSPTIRGSTIEGGKQAGFVFSEGGRGTVEDCDIAGNALSGVEIRSGGGPVIRRCRIHNGMGNGVHVCETGGGTIEDCEIFGQQSQGMMVQDKSNPTVRGCQVHDNKECGILVCEKGAGLFERCEVFGNGFAGFEIKQASEPVLRDCRIHTGRQGGLFVSERGRGLVEGCDIFANGLANVEVKDEGDPVLKSCTIAEGRTSGLYVYAGGRGTFEDCEIRANLLQGVAIKSGGNPVLRGCRIHSGKECGVFVYEKGAGLFESCDIYGNALANVEIKDAGNPVLSRCKVRDGKVCGLLVWVAATGQVEDCEISGNTYAGVEIKQAGNPAILRCRITGNGGSAFYIHEQGGGAVEGCDLKGNKLGPWDVGAGCKVRRQGNQE